MLNIHKENQTFIFILVYVTVKDTHEPTQIAFNIAEGGNETSVYFVRIEQIGCDSDKLAPPGCLTYGTESSGHITSYNNANGNGELINNQRFSHCIKHQEGYCDIELISNNFDMGDSGDTADSMSIGTNLFTDNSFGDGILLCELKF